MDENGISSSNGVGLPQMESEGSTQSREQQHPIEIHNKLLDQAIRTPGRQPSPQPTHLSVPGANQHRVIQDVGSGYVAPKFEGREQQKEEGEVDR